eukprot:GDKJ01017079.1.p1 GENE.GDKJ01017079.1~~GDKJ01017079.1.p1  ORF type:complete len:823 (+),score=211.00 GDKJ01017079.1:341-2470(+)
MAQKEMVSFDLSGLLPPDLDEEQEAQNVSFLKANLDSPLLPAESQDVKKKKKDLSLASMKRMAAKRWSSLEANNTEEKKYSAMVVYRRCLALLSDKKIFFLLALLTSVMRGLSSPYYGYLMGKATLVFFQTDPDLLMSQLNEQCGKIYVLAIWQIPIMMLGGFCYGRLDAAITQRSRVLLFESLLYQNCKFFDSPERSTGALVNALTSYTHLLRTIVGDSLMMILENSTTLIAAFVMSARIHFGLTMVMLMTYALILPGFFLEAKFQIMDQTAQENTLAEMEVLGVSDKTRHVTATQMLSELIAQVRTVQSLNAEHTFLSRYEERLNDALPAAVKHMKMYSTGAAISASFGFVAIVVHFAVGVWFVRMGSINPGDFWTVMTVMIMAGFSIGFSATAVVDQLKGLRAARSLFKLMDEENSKDLRSASQMNKRDLDATVDLANCRICFNDVRFFYPSRPANQVLKGVSFTIEPGQVTALVGPSGGGKSSIVQLMEGFYSIESGQKRHQGRIVLEDCVTGTQLDYAELSLEKLRNQISLVSQEPALFKGTIKDNVSVGSDNNLLVTVEEIQSALQVSNCCDFISSLPDGIESDVGRGGEKLSGGQKQRVAIARAVVRKPKILILDEATSALDNESEKVVQKALDGLMRTRRKMTTVVVAHRLTTIQNADKIVVFQPTSDGSYICEQGTHQELMSKDGLYSKLFKLSAGEAEE